MSLQGNNSNGTTIQITGTGFASGAIGAGINETVIGEIKKIKDPGTAQIVSAIVGAAAAKAAGGNAGAVASTAASGTRNNYELVASPEMANLATLCIAIGYVLITDETGEQSIVDMVERIPKTIAKYSDDVDAWLDANGTEIGFEIQDLIVWLKRGFELKRMPKDKIDELGGEDFTREVKKHTRKSKSDLYWNPKTGEVYSVQKAVVNRNMSQM